MRKISGFDPKDCYLDVALSAKAVIEPYSLEQIRDVSAGAATFFVWVSTFMYIMYWIIAHEKSMLKSLIKEVNLTFGVTNKNIR